ncbi:MAG: CHASE3 domain-containing protein, partial [Lentisphaeria bacterium]|nr:CHASE3 domain-containing protein [Lentisphaeria bacterium]
METGSRGYLLAGEEEFLDPYKAGSKSFHDQVKSLQKTVDDNPTQVQRLEDIKNTIEKWQKEVVDPNIELRRKIGQAKTMNDMAALVREARGKEYFDQFRGQVSKFISRERVLMEKRKKESVKASGVAQSSNKTVNQTTGWVTHTYEVIAQANDILAEAANMETGMRGFLLAGKEEFLDPYKGGKKAFYTKLNSLKQAVNDNPSQVKLLEEISNNIGEWNRLVTEPAIAMRREVGDGEDEDDTTMDDIADLVGEAQGKSYFDKFRMQISTFVSREAALMDKRKKDGKTAANLVESSILEVEQAAKWVDHTHEVIAAANSILASAVDMETGARGYLLAGKDEFLAPYTVGQRSFKKGISDLKQVVSDNPAQVQLLEEMALTISDWQKKVRRKIGTATTMDDMADIVGQAKGKVFFDKFRELIVDFKNQEHGNMVTRQDDNKSTASFTKASIIVGISITLLMSIVISLFLASTIT